MGDPNRGAYEKFTVKRMDGTDEPGGKHHGCAYFVLDLEHDEHAWSALSAYADSCEHEFPLLARDLRAALRASNPAACGCREFHCLHEPLFGWPSLGVAFTQNMDLDEPDGS